MVLWGGSHRNRTVSIMPRIGRNTLTGSVRSEISCVLSVAAKMRISFCAFLLSHPARGAWIEILSGRFIAAAVPFLRFPVLAAAALAVAFAPSLHLLDTPMCCLLRHWLEQVGEQVRLLLDGGVLNSAPQMMHLRIMGAYTAPHSLPAAAANMAGTPCRRSPSCRWYGMGCSSAGKTPPA